MGLSLQRRIFRSGKTHLPRGENLLKTAQQLLESPQNKVKIQLLVFILLSLILGFVAYSRSLKIAKTQWLKDHPPSLQTWNTVTRNKGFVELADPTTKEDLKYTLPHDLKGENQLWVDSENRLLALSRPEGMFFFSESGKYTGNGIKKIVWESLGMSWESVEALQNRTFYFGVSASVQTGKTAKKEFDPKRLVY